MDGTQRYTHLTAFHYCMIVPRCLPISLHLFCVHRVHIVLTLSHGFYVYETYTSGIFMVHISPQKGTQCIQHVYIRFSFSRLPIRPSGIYAFSNITFPIVPVAFGCLLVGSTPPWGPGPQQSYSLYYKNGQLITTRVVCTAFQLSKYGVYILINVKKTTVYTHVNSDRPSHIDNSKNKKVILLYHCTSSYVNVQQYRKKTFLFLLFSMCEGLSPLTCV